MTTTETAVWWDAHAPVSDDRGRRLPQPEGGGVTWHSPPNQHPPEPPPLPRTP